MEKKSIGEIANLTETEKHYRANERLEEFHCEMYDWTRVVADKWALAMWGQRGGN